MSHVCVGHFESKHELGVAEKRHKLIRYYSNNGDYFELFDLEKDPAEMTSVYDDPEYKSVREHLHEELASLRKKYKLEK